MHRMMYGGIGLFGIVWVVVMFGAKKYSQDFPPWLWKVVFGVLVFASMLYTIYCIFRIITSRRSKAEWFAESGVIGRFSLQSMNGGFFSKKYIDMEDRFVVRFSWIGKRCSAFTAEIPVEKIFLEVRSHYEGPPVVDFVFRDIDSDEPFRNIRPRIHSPSWWLLQRNADKLGFVCASIVMSREDFLTESMYVPFPSDHVRHVS